MKMKSYYLQPDTVLNEKYKIVKNIGEGGFGITYEALNQTINIRVAIKELYIKNLLVRDVEKSNSVSVQYEENTDDFERAKKHFLQEAKVLSEFSNAPGIVQILDYFEENNTAYIVMSYIDGINLSDYRKQHAMTWDDTFNMIKPVLVSLNKLHKKGIVHRDISANNIMITDDGLAYLIDFGTTKEIALSEESTSIVYSKKGYTPLEQFSDAGIVGPWSDIYAIMAVCYECITGTMIPTALQRTLVDEYKSLKEQKIAVPKELDAIFRKALAVDYKNRYQNVDELLSDIEHLEKKKEKKVKKRKKKFQLAGILFLLLCVVLGAIGYYNRDKIIFHNVETEEFCIFFDEDITLKEAKQNKEYIKERLEALADGEKYLIYEHNDYVRCIIPSKCFGDWDKSLFINYFLMPQYRWKISASTEEDYYYLENKYIQNVDYDDDSLIITFTDDTPDNVFEILEKATLSVCSVRGGNFHGIDVDKMEILNKNSCKIYLDTSTNFIKLLAIVYKQGDIVPKSTYVLNVNSDWEKIENGNYIGNYQKDIKYFKNNYVTLKYSSPDNFSDGEWLDTMIDLKGRLDVLKIPYAVGYLDESDKKIITIRVNQKDYNTDLFGLLNMSSVDISIWDERLRKISVSSFKSIKLKQKGDGVIGSFAYDEYGDSYAESFQNQIKLNSERNLFKFYFVAKEFPLLEGTMYGDPENQTFYFDKINIDNGEITKDNQIILDYLNYIGDAQKPNEMFNQFYFEEVQYSNFFQKICKEPAKSLSYANFDTSKYDDLIDSLQSAFPNAEIKKEKNQINYSCNVNMILSRDFYYESANNINYTEDWIRKILDITNAKNGMIFCSLDIVIPSKEDKTACAARISIDRRDSIYSENIDDERYYITLVGFEKDEGKWIENLYNDMKSQKEFESVMDMFYNQSGD